MSNILLMFYII